MAGTSAATSGLGIALAAVKACASFWSSAGGGPSTWGAGSAGSDLGSTFGSGFGSTFGSGFGSALASTWDGGGMSLAGSGLRSSLVSTFGAGSGGLGSVSSLASVKGGSTGFGSAFGAAFAACLSSSASGSRGAAATEGTATCLPTMIPSRKTTPSTISEPMTRLTTCRLSRVTSILSLNLSTSRMA